MTGVFAGRKVPVSFNGHRGEKIASERTSTTDNISVWQLIVYALLGCCVGDLFCDTAQSTSVLIPELQELFP